MELSFKELQKRDVINTSDGRCLGRITDMKLSFPGGVLTGITVPGRRVNFFLRLFDKSETFIPVSKITRIGGDVILVDLDCGEVCSPSVRGKKPKPPVPPPSPCDPCGEKRFGEFDSFEE